MFKSRSYTARVFALFNPTDTAELSSYAIAGRTWSTLFGFPFRRWSQKKKAYLNRRTTMPGVGTRVTALYASFLFLPLKFISHKIFEIAYLTVRDLIRDNVGPAGARYFPYIFSLFIFILLANVVGLVPYSFTITSHLLVTFCLALSSFIAINFIGIKKHGWHMLSLFLPPGSSLALAILLVPIEFISYIFRPISLSVRLFANMMAGHTLLKVIAGFAWVMTTLGFGLWLAHFIPIAILTILMGLELAVAIIQAYVFTILICIYLNDAIHLH